MSKQDGVERFEPECRADQECACMGQDSNGSYVRLSDHLERVEEKDQLLKEARQVSAAPRDSYKAERDQLLKAVRAHREELDAAAAGAPSLPATRTRNDVDNALYNTARSIEEAKG